MPVSTLTITQRCCNCVQDQLDLDPWADHELDDQATISTESTVSFRTTISTETAHGQEREQGGQYSSRGTDFQLAGGGRVLDGRSEQLRS